MRNSPQSSWWISLRMYLEFSRRFHIRIPREFSSEFLRNPTLDTLHIFLLITPQNFWGIRLWFLGNSLQNSWVFFHQNLWGFLLRISVFSHSIPRNSCIFFSEFLRNSSHYFYCIMPQSLKQTFFRNPGEFSSGFLINLVRTCAVFCLVFLVIHFRIPETLF